MQLHEQLSKAMKDRGLTPAQLATKVGVATTQAKSWIDGSDAPSTGTLQKLADILDLLPSELRFGNGGPLIEESALAQQRTAYTNDMYWYWRPAPRDEGREYGNAAGYAFETSIPILTRESAQNISDAALPNTETVEARYTVLELTGQHLSSFLERLQFDDLRSHLEAAAEHKKAGPVIKRGLEQIDKEDRLMLFRIEDFNSSGLNGPEFDTGFFMAVVRNVLDSQKAGNAGGSFGLGKATLWSSSQFGLVLINSNLSTSLDGNHNGRLIGRVDLPWHKMSDGGTWAGPGWFGIADPTDTGPTPKRTVSNWSNQAAARDLYLERPEGVTGTSFLIVGAFDASDTVESVTDIAEKFAEALADNFWPAMTDRPEGAPRLRAIVRAQRNDEPPIFEKFVDPSEYQKERVDMLTCYWHDQTKDELDQPGDVVVRKIALRVPARSTEPKHTALTHDAILLVAQASDSGGGRPETQEGAVSFMRGSLMVIHNPKVGALPIGARAFHAVVLAGRAAGEDPTDQRADRFLRDAEPPAHNKWIGTSDITANYAKGGKTFISEFEGEVKRAIRDIIRTPSRDLSDGPDALKELLRIKPPPTGTRPKVRAIGTHTIGSDGEWILTDVEITLPAKPAGKVWRLTPTLRFGTESGAPIHVEWSEVTALHNCKLNGTDELLCNAGASTIRFSAISEPGSHPVGAGRAKMIVDVKVN